jgi:hypothetical protein
VVLVQLLVAQPVQEAVALLLGPGGERDAQGGCSRVLDHLDKRAGGWPTTGGVHLGRSSCGRLLSMA